MSKLFTNGFLVDYSFTGKKGKKKFCDLFIFPIILSEYIIKNYNTIYIILAKRTPTILFRLLY